MFWYCAGCSSELNVGLLFIENEHVILAQSRSVGKGSVGKGR